MTAIANRQNVKKKRKKKKNMSFLALIVFSFLLSVSEDYLDFFFPKP